MFRVVGRIDTVEKITEVAANVAGLPQPHDSAPGDISRRGLNELHGWIHNRVLIQR
jgi:hypothetical protein